MSITDGSVNLGKIAAARRWRLDVDPASPFGPHADRVDPDLLTVPCRYGHLYRHGKDLIGVAVDSRQVVRRIKQLGHFPTQDGDDGANFAVPLSALWDLAEIMQPRRKRNKTGGRNFARREALCVAV